MLGFLTSSSELCLSERVLLCLQVSAHGTGASIPPVDEMVVSMKLVTPGKGTLEVSRAEDPELFRMAKVGLGALGIVSEVTLQLVPSHKLLEHTYIMSSKVWPPLISSFHNFVKSFVTELPAVSSRCYGAMAGCVCCSQRCGRAVGVCGCGQPALSSKESIRGLV